MLQKTVSEISILFGPCKNVLLSFFTMNLGNLKEGIIFQ